MKQNIDLLQKFDYRKEKRVNAIMDFDSNKRKMVRLFCKIYFWNSNCWSWCEYLSGYMRETICVNVNDKYFHIRDIYVALYYDITYEKLMERYKYSERQERKHNAPISLINFIHNFK